MVGNRAWSEEATQGRLCTKWRPLNEESVYLIRDGVRKRGEWEKGREGRREGGIQKKEGHSLASDESESERGVNILKASRASKSEKSTELTWKRLNKEWRKKTVHLWFVWKIQQALRRFHLEFLLVLEGRSSALSVSLSCASFSVFLRFMAFYIPAHGIKHLFYIEKIKSPSERIYTDVYGSTFTV